MVLIVLLPLLTSVVVRTFAWIVILGRQGIVNTTLLSLGVEEAPLRLLYTEPGLVVALAQVQLPLMVLPLMTALGWIEPNLAEASAALGAGAWGTFLRVTLPLSLPGMVAGIALTFTGAVTAFVTQALIGGGHTVVCVPYVIRTTTAALAQLDGALLDSSASLGASGPTTFRRVTLPLIRPGVLSGAFVCFMASFDNVPVSLFLRDAATDMMAIRMWQNLEGSLDVTIAAASTVLILLTVLAAIVAERIAGLSKRL